MSMITLPHKEANHLNLIENSTSSPTLDDLFDFYPVYSSGSCMECLESCSCLNNYHILPVNHHLPSSEDLGDFKPLFSTLENSFLDQDDDEEWLEPFPVDDEESDSLMEDECPCGAEMNFSDEHSGCNCRVFNWLLEEYKQKRWGNNSGWTESPLCLVDAPLGSPQDLVALIEKYLELNAIPSDNFNGLMNFVMFNQNLPKSQSNFIDIKSEKTNDLIANMSKALAKSLLCTSEKKITENKLGESPLMKTTETQLVLRKNKKTLFKNRTPIISIPLQLFPSLQYIFYTLQGKYQQKQARKAQKLLAIKPQEEEKPEESQQITIEETSIETKEEEIAVAAVQTEQFRYRLVKKSDIRRDALNSSCLSSVSNYNNESYREKSRNSPKPTFLLENFLSSIEEDEKDDFKPPVEQNSSDEDRLLDLGLGLKKEKDESKTDEENAEVETRAGSQKENESLLQQFDGFSEFTIKTSSVIEKEEEGFSQASNDLFFQENDGFIQILDKRKGKKERKDRGRRDRGYGKSKHESAKKEEPKGKARETAYSTVVYEAKNKPEGPKAKILTPILSKNSSAKPIIPLNNYAPTPAVVVENQAAVVSMEKPKRKALSVKSACLDMNIVKATKVKDFVKKYCEKKFEEDLNEYVGKITEESNKMMDYRMLVHTRIDYCLKKVFEGINVQTKIFGSCATGLALPTSDVDICLCGLPTYSRNEVIQYITTIYDKLKKFKWVSSIKQILTSNVPIVKLEIDPTIDFKELHEELDEYSLLRGMIDKAPEDLDCLKDAEGNIKIKIDLSIESFSPLGTTTPHLGYRTTEFVQKKLNEYESLYAVAMYLKEYLTKKGFLDNYQGGISSYCLVIMIVAIFRKFTDEGGMKSLKRLLNFYGEEFEPEKTGINVVGAEPFFALNYSFDEVPLWIMDNANFAGRSLGQGAFGIKRIFQEFAGSMKIIRKTQEKIEAIALKYKEKVDSMEDIEKIDDAELKELIETNIAEKLIMMTAE